MDGAVVAITGASSGIGEATARLLASRGATVALGARRADRLEQLARELRAQGTSVLVATTDVTRREDVERLVGATVEEFGRLDVLVSNAGIAHLGPVSDGDVDGWSAMIDTELHDADFGIPAEAVARAIAFALEQPPDVEIGDITIRLTAQG